MPSPTMSTWPFCELQQRGQRLGTDLEVDLVQVGHALDVVVGVALEDEFLAEIPLVEIEGAGAVGVMTVIGTPLLDVLLGDDAGEVERDDLKEGRVGLRERDRDRIGIDDLDAGQMVRPCRPPLRHSRRST